ncbi:MAG: DUF4258 domain-containing protein [Burkholderiales bacterium]|nr:DUF4258 domain-containing protein [Phycisphaerae bacterium]
MTSAARKAIAVIRECIASDTYAISVHFRERMDQRGLFWPDIQAVIDEPHDVVSCGEDRFDRPKWVVSGRCATDDDIEIICAIEIDNSGTEFITLYWVD